MAAISTELNDEVLGELVETVGGIEVFATLVDTFLAEVVTLTARLEESTQNNDAAGLRAAYHTLGSSAGMFGALQLTAACRTAEAAAADVDWETLNPMLAPTLAAAAELPKRLHNWMQSS